MHIPKRQIRAVYNDETVRVYQAYSRTIAGRAVKAGRFVAPFKMERMTWIKPSFFWMMYRCGWGDKAGQERVLAIDITREGFEWALGNACLSHYVPELYESQDAWTQCKEASPVRIQWDPERDKTLEKLDYRSIQIGLSEEAVVRYNQEWIRDMRDITAEAELIRSGRDDLIPVEKPYPLSTELAARIGADPV